MKIVIGSDHCGVDLKAALVRALEGVATVEDKGTMDRKSCDYNDYAVAVVREIAGGTADFGILVCKTGIGMSMAANRFQNVRAALCATTDVAVLARQHNDANVICLSAGRSSGPSAFPTARG